MSKELKPCENHGCARDYDVDLNMCPYCHDDQKSDLTAEEVIMQDGRIHA